MQITNLQENQMTLEKGIENFLNRHLSFSESKGSLQMDEKEFEDFKEEYGLEFFFESKNELNSKFFTFISPTNQLIVIKENRKNNYLITELIDSKQKLKNMEDVIRHLSKESEFNPEVIFQKIFCDYICSISKDYVYEDILNRILRINTSSPRARTFDDYIKGKHQECIKASFNVKKPKIDSLYRMVNVNDEDSYLNVPVRVIDVTDSYVYYEGSSNIDSDYDICELYNFEKYFESVEKSYPQIEELINSALCYYLDDELISDLCAGNKNNNAEMRCVTIDRDDFYSYNIINDIGEFNVCELCLYPTVTLTYSNENEEINEYKTFGSTLDLPYILMNIEPKSLDEAQMKSIQIQFAQAKKIIDLSLLEVIESNMVSVDYKKDLKTKITKNMEKLSNNFNKICERLANYDYMQTKENEDLEFE